MCAVVRESGLSRIHAEACAVNQTKVCSRTLPLHGSQFVCGKAVASRPCLGVMTRTSGDERAEGLMTTSVVDPVWRFAVVAPSDWCGDVLGRQHVADGGDSGE